ncbi:MAG TPA: amidase family protein [Vicinamibacterales bacterium]|nr:amidase family protein [Vicinamibacterales bacterium]
MSENEGDGFSRAELAAPSAIEIRDLIRERKISVVEAVEASLQRVDRFNPAINAIVTLNPRAIDDARALDQRLASGEDPGPLCGLTVGIKDVTQVASLRTTFGSTIYSDHVPDEDAVVVQRLREAGAIILGKTNTPEFAAGGNTFNEVFGRTRNPWDTTKSAGGSTGGGAAALVTGMIQLAEGTDLGGSLRIPASFCGVVGLRPSVGLVPTHPTDWSWDTLQVTGPMARTAEDVALMLQSIAGATEHSPLRQPVAGRDFVAAVKAGPKRGARIAYVSDPTRIGIEPEIEHICREAAFGLKDAGPNLAIEEIDLDLSPARAAFLALRGLWFVTHMAPRMDKASQFGTNVGNNVRAGLTTTTEQLAAAEQERNRLWHLFRDFFMRFDYLVTPCMAVPPFPVEQNYPDAIAGTPMQTYVDWLAPTFVLSLTGLPVASVPCGLDSGGMPVGLQIVARPSDEEAALALAGAMQQRYPKATASRA